MVHKNVNYFYMMSTINFNYEMCYFTVFFHKAIRCIPLKLTGTKTIKLSVKCKELKFASIHYHHNSHAQIYHYIIDCLIANAHRLRLMIYR